MKKNGFKGVRYVWILLCCFRGWIERQVRRAQGQGLVSWNDGLFKAAPVEHEQNGFIGYRFRVMMAPAPIGDVQGTHVSQVHMVRS